MNIELNVVPFYGNWAIFHNRNDFPMSTHVSKNEALELASKLSKRLNCKVNILDSNEQSDI